jgi:hypothetical protein
MGPREATKTIVEHWKFVCSPPLKKNKTLKTPLWAQDKKTH